MCKITAITTQLTPFFYFFTGGIIMFYFPAALSSTATLLWLLRCYLNALTTNTFLKIICLNYKLCLKYKLIILKFKNTHRFQQFKFLPSDRQLVHQELMLHRCVYLSTITRNSFFIDPNFSVQSVIQLIFCD